MINRNILYQQFRNEYSDLKEREAILIFRSMTDKQFADIYGLKVLRKGYFTHLK